ATVTSRAGGALTGGGWGQTLPDDGPSLLRSVEARGRGGLAQPRTPCTSGSGRGDVLVGPGQRGLHWGTTRGACCVQAFPSRAHLLPRTRSPSRRIQAQSVASRFVSRRSARAETDSSAPSPSARSVTSS